MTLKEVKETLQTWIATSDDEYDREEMGRVCGLKEALHEINKIDVCTDAISRKAAYEIVDNMLMGERNHKSKALDEIKFLPSVMPAQNVCTDAISRRAAIDAFEKRAHIDWERLKVLDPLLEEIDELPSVSMEKPNRWIPVSERLPENGCFVIVTIKDESGDSLYLYSDFGWYLDKAACWIIDAEQRTDIIAWMPLPAPYDPQERSEKG